MGQFEKDLKHYKRELQENGTLNTYRNHGIFSMTAYAATLSADISMQDSNNFTVTFESVGDLALFCHACDRIGEVV